MNAPLRLLFVADPATAQRAVEPVRRHVAVEAALAPAPSVLAAALRDAALRGAPWSAVLFTSGGPISATDVARVMAGQTVPLVVVGPGDVPAAFAGLRAIALDEGRLEALPFVLTSLTAEASAQAADAFVGAANATFAESKRAAARLPDALAAATALPAVPAAPSAAPPSAAAPRAEAGTARPPATMSAEAESLAQHLPVGVYRTTPAGRILYANPALADVLGVESLEALEAIHVHRDLGYPRETFAEEMRRTGAVRNLIVRWTTPRGDAVVTRENARAVVDAAGEIVFYEGVMEDVTAEAAAQDADRARARHHEAVVRFAEAADGAATPGALYLAAVRSLHDALGADWAFVVQHDAGGNRVAAWAGRFTAETAQALASDAAFAQLPVVSQPILLRDVESSPPAWLPDPIAALMRTHGMRSMGCFPLHRSGQPLGSLVVGFDAPHTFTAGERQAGEVLAWHLAGHLARHRAERDLQGSEASRRDTETSLRFIAEHSAQVLYRLRYVAGGPARFDYLSPAVEALTGYTRAELDKAGGMAALVEARDVFAGDGLFSAAVEGHAHYHAVYRIRTKSGAERYVENHAYPWHDAAGTAVGLVGALQDVTERKLREEALVDAAQQALACQSALVELSRVDAAGEVFARAAELACETAGADGASVWLVDGPWMACRALYTSGTGAPDAGASDAAEAPGPEREPPLVTPTYPADAFAAALSVLDGQRSLTVDDAASDPRVDTAGLRPLAEALGLRSFVASPVRRGAETVGMVVVSRNSDAWTEAEAEFVGALADAVALASERDERAQAEGALRASEARYRVLSDLTSDYAFAVRADASGALGIVWATDSFSRTSGYTPEEVTDAASFRALIHPDSWADVAEAVTTLGERGAVRLEVRIVTRAGDIRWLDHSARFGEAEADGSALVYHSGRDVSERKQAEADSVAARDVAECARAQAEAAREEAERAREEAEASREHAEEMARLKSAFLANMSHEIRTPLTGILGYAELLADEVDAEQRDFVEAISQSGVRLLDTLNSVLDLARLESEGVRPDLKSVDVGAEVRAAVRLLGPLAAKRGLTVAVEGGDAEAPAVASLDAACLGRIVTNLVGNALKFTESGGVTVRVAVEPAGAESSDAESSDAESSGAESSGAESSGAESSGAESSGAAVGESHVVVRVADTGIGIAESFLPHLFDEFRQETDGPGRSHEGSGLGLSITKRLVELMGGRIGVTSRRPGGSVFTVSFPALARAVPPLFVSAGVLHAASAGDGVADLPVPDLPVPDLPLPDLPVPNLPDVARLPPAPLPAPSGTGFAVPVSSSLPAPAASAAPALLPDSAPTSMFNFRFSPSTKPPLSETPNPVPDPAPAADEPVSPYAPPVGWHPVVDALPQGADVPAGEGTAATPVPPAPVPELLEDPVMLVRPARAAPPEDPPAQPTEGAGARPPLLVVEDNLDTRMLLERILRASYDVTAVGDARSALVAMAQRRFRGFVLDINLGGKETGTDVLRVARTIEGYADVYAVALTAYALPGDRDRLLESGFDEYISKPFTRQSLLDALAEGIQA